MPGHETLTALGFGEPERSQLMMKASRQLWTTKVLPQFCSPTSMPNMRVSG